MKSAIAARPACSRCRCAAADAQTYKSSAGDLAVETVVGGLVASLGARLPARRPHAGDRAARPHAHRTPDGKLSPPLAGVPKVFASGQGGLHDVVLDRGFAQNQTIYFCFAEPARRRRRAPRWRAPRLADDQARRREGDLPPGGPAVERPAFRLPHRADAGQQPVPDHGRSRLLPQRGAEPRQPHRQDRAHRARRLGAERQSVRRPRRRQAGNLELRPPQFAGRGAASRRPASCGRTSTARAAATRSTLPRRARTTAGR